MKYLYMIPYSEITVYISEYAIWNIIASQLALPCVTDEKFIKTKRRERKKLEKKQNEILSNIERLQQKTKAS